MTGLILPHCESATFVRPHFQTLTPCLSYCIWASRQKYQHLYQPHQSDFTTDTQCVYFSCVFQETHLTINDSPGTRDFVVAADPVVDGLSWLGQVDLRNRVTHESTC